ncbi:MAG: tRNA lysidine(34) synthetase TilS [Anaerolineales bacterium]|jgi:tRNA(Ile)-lysidine synthase|nr:tRNA lysidine(34) synthetase TilS [Anaerolineales bacterium]
MDLLHHLRDFERETRGADWDGGVVVGVSGGPDSLALLHLLSQLSGRHPLVHVAHLDHGLRPDSADDAEFVADIARSWGLPISIGRQEVAAMASERKLSLEEAGRQARYAFLVGVAQNERHNLILVGHNGDDQVETVLMHLLRGAGLSGLRGMRPLTPMTAMRLPTAATISMELQLGRPLLEVTRAEIEAYCREHGLQPRHDATNADTTFFRNRLRHEILPLLASVKPNLHASLRRMANVLGEDQLVLQQVTQVAWRQVVARQDESLVLLRRGEFTKLLPGLQRGLLRHAILQLRPDLCDIGFEPVSQAVDFCANAQVRQQRSLPGELVLTVDYEHLVIAPVGAEPRQPNGLPLLCGIESIPLAAPGDTSLGECGWSVCIDKLGDVRMKSIRANRERWQAYLDADQLHAPLRMRPRRRGERFQPLGMHSGSQSLADFMTNAKIPHAWRNRLPVLVSGERVLWVPGWRLDQRARVRRSSRRIWRIRMLPPA